MISYRTLRNWRKDALNFYNLPTLASKNELYMNSRILRLTQDLMDTHLRFQTIQKRKEKI